MIFSNKEDLRPERALRALVFRIQNGFRALCQNRNMAITAVVYWVLVAHAVLFSQPDNPLTRILWTALQAVLVIAAAVLFLSALVVIGTPRGALTMEHDLLRAGVTNSVGEPPILLSMDANGQQKTAVFYSCGISISKYQDLLPQIEAALNQRITRIEEGRDKQTVVLHLAAGDVKLPTKIEWSDSFLQKEDFVLSIGSSLDGLYKVNLNVTPHMIVAGSTGSGKTVLLKNIIHQCLKKDAQVYLIDMKGGMDYPNRWKHGACSYCEERYDALSVLSGLVNELNSRKETLSQCNCANISEYNATHEEKLPHIVVVLDEIAELTVTTGLDKEQKALVEKTNRQLDTIARMGRAPGIHLIIGTQRPDANVLPGQIKANCDVRICGRADNTLSMIILDNTDAADRIPKGNRGRFLTNDGVEFQGYWMDI